MMKTWLLNSVVFKKGLKRRYGIKKSMHNLGPIEKTSESEYPNPKGRPTNIPSWGGHDNSSFINVSRLFAVKDIRNFETFLVRDNSGDSLSIYFDIENPIFEIENDHSFLSELESSFYSYLQSQICIDTSIVSGSDSSDSSTSECVFDKGRTSSASEGSGIQNHEKSGDFTLTESSNDLGATSSRNYSHLWVRCENEECYGLNYRKYFFSKLNICEHCGYHLKMTSCERIEFLIDPGTWDPMDEDMVSLDPIAWDSEEEPYHDHFYIYSFEELEFLVHSYASHLRNASHLPHGVGGGDRYRCPHGVGRGDRYRCPHGVGRGDLYRCPHGVGRGDLYAYHLRLGVGDLYASYLRNASHLPHGVGGGDRYRCPHGVGRGDLYAYHLRLGVGDLYASYLRNASHLPHGVGEGDRYRGPWQPKPSPRVEEDGRCAFQPSHGLGGGDRYQCPFDYGVGGGDRCPFQPYDPPARVGGGRRCAWRPRKHSIDSDPDQTGLNGNGAVQTGVGQLNSIDSDPDGSDPDESYQDESYKDRLDSYQDKTGLTEAVQTGVGQLNGIPIALAVMDFQFMGGSMGSAVGEKITRLIEYATNQFLPLIIVCASGGARMQEGSLSLMQMAKISSALLDYQANKKLLYVSILTSPTTGGVTASFGMLGDIIIAEPNSYIAFAGKRVIEQTLNITVPEGSQEAEPLFEKGLFDLIVPRNLLKSVLIELFKFHDLFPLNSNSIK